MLDCQLGIFLRHDAFEDDFHWGRLAKPADGVRPGHGAAVEVTACFGGDAVGFG